MNGEFLTVLDHIEREKGISRDVILEAVMSALQSAAKRVVREKDSDINVSIDQKTGDISVKSDGKEIDSAEFGRIAAQTAKQVIIQKIREAERDAIFDDFHTKVNSVVSGTIYRYDKGAVIIDLGKTEALLPKREQSPRDSFRQGDRVRVYVMEVSKSAKGPQVLVSRAHPSLVKKLFEMEVPEVLEGIVEIKAVARDPGDRAKIAVWSKDEKVDSVGACVGMRGLRVKNIVRELQGEKIDIVRWSEDISEYVQGALSPAQSAQVNITNRDEKRIEVIVDDDQLSLAIGKNGQNVRLAAKLTGWMIDLHSKKELAKEKLEAGEAAVSQDIEEADIVSVSGLSNKVLESLKAAGIDTVGVLRQKSVEELTQLEGIGGKTAAKIQDAVKRWVEKTKKRASDEKQPKSVVEDNSGNQDLPVNEDKISKEPEEPNSNG